MKKNNKGFMLAEVVITSTVVMTAMISLYFTFNKIYKRYNTLLTYKNIDGMYAIESMIDSMLEDGSINEVISKNNGIIINNEGCFKKNGNGLNYCMLLKDTYNINNMIIIPKQKEKISNLSVTVTNQTFKEYLTYLTKYYSFNDNDNKYLIILEYKIDNSNNNSYNYSSMELG